MNGETLRLTPAEQDQMTRNIDEFTDRFGQWADERFAKDENARISCGLFAKGMKQIVAICLDVQGTVADCDIAFPSSQYPDVTEYIKGQITASGKPLIYDHDGVEERFVPSIFDGLWVWHHPTVRPHIVGSHFIPLRAR